MDDIKLRPEVIDAYSALVAELNKDVSAKALEAAEQMSSPHFMRSDIDKAVQDAMRLREIKAAYLDPSLVEWAKIMYGENGSDLPTKKREPFGPPKPPNWQPPEKPETAPPPAPKPKLIERTVRTVDEDEARFCFILKEREDAYSGGGTTPAKLMLPLLKTVATAQCAISTKTVNRAVESTIPLTEDDLRIATVSCGGRADTPFWRKRVTKAKQRLTKHGMLELRADTFWKLTPIGYKFLAWLERREREGT